MKSLLGLLAFAMLISSCDDGDLTFESINFDDVIPKRCANKTFKLNEKEALIVKVGDTEDEFDNFFIENPTIEGSPRIIEIVNPNIDIQVVYRLFDGEVSDNSICESIPPINPSAIENWNANSGQMQIVTATKLAENTAPGFEGGQKITDYRHSIIFTNIEFDRSNGTTQLYPTFNFGTLEIPISVSLPIQFDTDLEKCNGSPRIYNIAGTHALALTIDPALLDGTILDTPRIGEINSSANLFQYLIYEEGNLSGDTHFCTVTPVANPLQIWIGTGQVEVTTTQVGSGFQHTIILKNVVLKKGNSEFILAAEYEMGILLTE